MSNSIDETFFLNADKFFAQNAAFGLTYDDVSLATQYSDILPRQTRLDTSISDKVSLSLPIISSDMDTVTESQMAIGHGAQRGARADTLQYVAKGAAGRGRARQKLHSRAHTGPDKSLARHAHRRRFEARCGQEFQVQDISGRGRRKQARGASARKHSQRALRSASGGQGP